jgi:hypothetical protein
MNSARKFAFNFALGLVPDALICWTYMKLVNGDWYDFFVAYLVLLGLSFFLWLKGSVWTWLMFWTFGKQQIANYIEKTLSDGKLPVPLTTDNDLDDYFQNIMEDDQIDIPTRMKAAFELGTMNGLKTSGEFGAFTRLLIASKPALKRYARYAPARSSRKMTA